VSVVSNKSPLVILMDDRDNVAIVANDGGLPAGTQLPSGLVLKEHVPQGHKVALVDLPEGGEVRRYNVTIGRADKTIEAGRWVHEKILRMPDARNFENLPIATQKAPVRPALEGYTFEGFRNPDGSVGTRNVLGITTTVQCVAGVMEIAVKRIKDELLPQYPNVDDVVGLEHGYGCGVAIDAPDAPIPIRTVRNIALNPNFGGEVMVLSLGCEKLQPDRLLPPGSIAIGENVAAAPDVVRLQDDKHVGFMSMVDSIMGTARVHLERLNARKRETVSASELVVGVQCGGSDAFSGVTANPAVGFATDLLVRAGATVMFSENTEVRDGVAQLTARAADAAVADAIVAQLAWYDNYLQRGKVDRSANTTPGNKAGGLSNIVGHGLDRQVGFIDHLARDRPGREAAPGPARPGLCLHARQRLRLRHAAAGCRHEPARLHHRTRHALRPGRLPGDQGGDAQRPGAPLARPDGHQRRPHRRRRVDHRGDRLGAVQADARRGQREKTHLGRAVEAAQLPGAVQPGADHLTLQASLVIANAPMRRARSSNFARIRPGACTPLKSRITKVSRPLRISNR
jgi:galactarate dehydratase